MIDDKFLLLTIHPCVRGLGDEAVHEIADATQLKRFKSGTMLHQANELVGSVDFVIHGKLRVNFLDSRGKVIKHRFETPGGQFGGLNAALKGPAPVECVAEEPTTILRLSSDDCQRLTAKHDAFRVNLLQAVADNVRQYLFQRDEPVKPRMVAVFHQSPETRELTRKLCHRLVELGERPCVLTDNPDWKSVEGVRDRNACDDENLNEQEARRQIHAWTDADRIIIDAEVSPGSEGVTTLHTCELALWCVTPEDWERSVIALRFLLSRSPTWRDKVCIVWLLREERVAPQAAELNHLASRNIKLSFCDPGEHQSDALKNGFERLIHLLRGIQIGLALGGGGARGMANLGVADALEKHGIIVDMIAGTSAGSMTGTVHASGIEYHYALDCFTNDLTPSWMFRGLPAGEAWYLIYNYRRGNFDPMLRRYLHDYTLEQLPIPMHSVTVDLISGSVVVKKDGDAVNGIIESINLPVLSLPLMRDGQALVDGGMINNVPADILAAKGCNFIIAVSVTAKMEHEFASNRHDTPAEKVRRPSTLQTILRTYLVQSSSVNAYGVQPADIVIEPDLQGFDLGAFRRTKELAAIGEKTTDQSIPEIKHLLAEMDSRLFGS